MTIPFRILDTGLRNAREQIALDQALIELHKAGQSPDTIRFVRFPPTVLLGRHQAVSEVVNPEYCRDHGVGIVRRMTGGGAIYLDEGQIGWELLISRRRFPMASLADYTVAICSAVAHGLSRTFGIDARFRPRTDIEVAGKKLCGTSGYFNGDTLIYQGTLLVDVDPTHIYRCLRGPEPDPKDNRLTTLKSLLGDRAPPLASIYQAVLLGLMEKLSLEPAPGQLSQSEEGLAQLMLEAEIAKDDFVFEIDDPGGLGRAQAHRQTPGGSVSAYVRNVGEGDDRRIESARIAGDFFVLPPRFVFDLEAALRGVKVADVATVVRQVLTQAPPEMLTLSPEDLCGVIAAAAMEPSRS